MPRVQTNRGYDFFDCASAMQKAIRRNEADVAGFFALELHESGYVEYVWKRLLIISAEDCYGHTITTEIYNLYRAHRLANDGAKRKTMIFVAKAVLILSRTAKSRDSDHLCCQIFLQEWVRMDRVQELLKEAKAEPREVPDYAFDVHTKRGRIMGKTRRDFFLSEFEGLEPRQEGLFDHVIDDIKGGRK